MSEAAVLSGFAHLFCRQGDGSAAIQKSVKNVKIQD